MAILKDSKISGDLKVEGQIATNNLLVADKNIGKLVASTYKSAGVETYGMDLHYNCKQNVMYKVVVMASSAGGDAWVTFNYKDEYIYKTQMMSWYNGNTPSCNTTDGANKIHIGSIHPQQGLIEFNFYYNGSGLILQGESVSWHDALMYRRNFSGGTGGAFQQISTINITCGGAYNEGSRVFLYEYPNEDTNGDDTLEDIPKIKNKPIFVTGGFTGGSYSVEKWGSMCPQLTIEHNPYNFNIDKTRITIPYTGYYDLNITMNISSYNNLTGILIYKNNEIKRDNLYNHNGARQSFSTQHRDYFNQGDILYFGLYTDQAGTMTFESGTRTGQWTLEYLGD